MNSSFSETHPWPPLPGSFFHRLSPPLVISCPPWSNSSAGFCVTGTWVLGWSLSSVVCLFALRDEGFLASTCCFYPLGYALALASFLPDHRARHHRTFSAMSSAMFLLVHLSPSCWPLSKTSPHGHCHSWPPLTILSLVFLASRRGDTFLHGPHCFLHSQAIPTPNPSQEQKAQLLCFTDEEDVYVWTQIFIVGLCLKHIHCHLISAFLTRKFSLSHSFLLIFWVSPRY